MNEKSHGSVRLSRPHSQESKHPDSDSTGHGQEGPGSEKCRPPDTAQSHRAATPGAPSCHTSGKRGSGKKSREDKHNV